VLTSGRGSTLRQVAGSTADVSLRCSCLREGERSRYLPADFLDEYDPVIRRNLSIGDSRISASACRLVAPETARQASGLRGFPGRGTSSSPSKTFLEVSLRPGAGGQVSRLGWRPPVMRQVRASVRLVGSHVRRNAMPTPITARCRERGNGADTVPARTHMYRYRGAAVRKCTGATIAYGAGGPHACRP